MKKINSGIYINKLIAVGLSVYASSRYAGFHKNCDRMLFIQIYQNLIQIQNLEKFLEKLTLFNKLYVKRKATKTLLLELKAQ